MIDPRWLRTFHEVCETGSITRAAQALNISQPSVSSAIAALEGSLGAVLFQRTRAGIVLTPAGEALRAKASMLDHLLRDAAEEIAAVREGIVGPLRVGGTPGALVSLLPAAIARLEAAHPRLALNVLERADHELTAMLRGGRIELAFVTTGIDQPPPDIAERTIARDPFALIVGPANAGLGETISLRAAEGLRWVLPEAQGAFRRQVDALFLAAGVQVPRDVIRCDSLLTTKAIVRTSDRVTILPVTVPAAELAVGALRAIRLAEAMFERQVGVRWLAGARASALAEKLLAALDIG